MFRGFENEFHKPQTIFLPPLSRRRTGAASTAFSAKSLFSPAIPRFEISEGRSSTHRSRRQVGVGDLRHTCPEARMPSHRW